METSLLKINKQNQLSKHFTDKTAYSYCYIKSIYFKHCSICPQSNSAKIFYHKLRMSSLKGLFMYVGSYLIILYVSECSYIKSRDQMSILIKPANFEISKLFRTCGIIVFVL